jgi:hypothetical protein
MIDTEFSPQSHQFVGEEMETRKPREETEQKFQELLKAVKETLQLSEFLIVEKKLLHEFCLLLRQIMKQFNIRFYIPTKIVSKSGRVKQVILSEEAHLIIVNENNEIISKALEDYPPHVIVNVALAVIPELNKWILSYREKISLRVSLFEKINRELKSLFQTFSVHGEKHEKTSDTTPTEKVDQK